MDRGIFWGIFFDVVLILCRHVFLPLIEKAMWFLSREIIDINSMTFPSALPLSLTLDTFDFHKKKTKYEEGSIFFTKIYKKKIIN